jgi:hypothetical protein
LIHKVLFFVFPQFQSSAKKQKSTKRKEKGRPLEIVSDLVFETGRRIHLPLQELLLEPIASNLTQNLTKRKIRYQKTEKSRYKIENRNCMQQWIVSIVCMKSRRNLARGGGGAGHA